jgi:hypothetical protein
MRRKYDRIGAYLEHVEEGHLFAGPAVLHLDLLEHGADIPGQVIDLDGDAVPFIFLDAPVQYSHICDRRSDYFRLKYFQPHGFSQLQDIFDGRRQRYVFSLTVLAGYFPYPPVQLFVKTGIAGQKMP